MSLLDILKAYHMRFETAPDRQKEIRRIWSAFNESPPSESDRETHDDEASKAAAARLAQRKYAVEAHVIPALLMRCDIDPWPESANSPQNADLLKGIMALIGETESLTGNYLHRATSISLTCLNPFRPA